MRSDDSFSLSLQVLEEGDTVCDGEDEVGRLGLIVEHETIVVDDVHLFPVVRKTTEHEVTFVLGPLEFFEKSLLVLTSSLRKVTSGDFLGTIASCDIREVVSTKILEAIDDSNVRRVTTFHARRVARTNSGDRLVDEVDLANLFVQGEAKATVVFVSVFQQVGGGVFSVITKGTVTRAAIVTVAVEDFTVFRTTAMINNHALTTLFEDAREILFAFLQRLHNMRRWCDFGSMSTLLAVILITSDTEGVTDTADTDTACDHTGSVEIDVGSETQHLTAVLIDVTLSVIFVAMATVEALRRGRKTLEAGAALTGKDTQVTSVTGSAGVADATAEELSAIGDAGCRHDVCSHDSLFLSLSHLFVISSSSSSGVYRIIPR